MASVCLLFICHWRHDCVSLSWPSGWPFLTLGALPFDIWVFIDRVALHSRQRMGSVASVSLSPSVHMFVWALPFEPFAVTLMQRNISFISQKLLTIGSWHLVRTWTWMTPILTLNVRVIGQRSRSPGQKNMISGPIRPPYRHSLRSRVTWVKVKGHMGQGQRSILKVKGQGHQVKNVISGPI